MCVFPQGHVNMALQDQAFRWKQSHTQNSSLGWEREVVVLTPSPFIIHV